jgi:hypothetical protein
VKTSRTSPWLRPLTALLPLTLAAGLTACGGGGNGNGQHGGPTAAEATLLIDTILSFPVESLSAAESQSLTYIREEEKLAHDVYAVAATQWGLNTFVNIGTSETMHQQAMNALLTRYGVTDPVAGMADGQFNQQAFTALYTQLSDKTRLSLVDALQVGLEIEELDIKDIETEKLGVDNADIRYAYDELLRGSRNHLRAFWKQLQQRGGNYTPSHITQAQFDAIASSATEPNPTPR